MKKVTIIIPCHNSVEYLDECWESVLNQTIGLDNLQVIMVDDASTDDTWEHLKKYKAAAADSVMIIRLETNRRQGGARNEALRYAEGKYIRFLDSDDVLPPDSTKRLYEMAETYELEMLQFGHIDFEGELKEEPLCMKNPEIISIENDIDRHFFLAGRKWTCTHHMRLYRTDFVKKVDTAFAENLIYEEPLFVYPMYFYAQKIGVTDEVMYYLRLHNSSTMHSEALKRLRDNPKVQFMLMKDLIGRKLLEEFYYEIESYFLENYYLITLYNIFTEECGLTIDEFKNIQNVIRSLFPGWRDSPYMSDELEKLYAGIDMEFDDMSQVAMHRNALDWSLMLGK